MADIAPILSIVSNVCATIHVLSVVDPEADAYEIPQVPNARSKFAIPELKRTL